MWLWIDTICIDKRSSAELSEAINSMYSWYMNAEVCFAYLSDVPAWDGLSVGLGSLGCIISRGARGLPGDGHYRSSLRRPLLSSVTLHGGLSGTGADSGRKVDMKLRRADAQVPP